MDKDLEEFKGNVSRDFTGVKGVGFPVRKKDHLQLYTKAPFCDCHKTVQQYLTGRNGSFHLKVTCRHLTNIVTTLTVLYVTLIITLACTVFPAPRTTPF